MKNVFGKIGEVLLEAAKFIVVTMLLVILVGILAIGFAMVPLLGLALTIFAGGSLVDNTCEMLAEFKRLLGWNTEN